MPRPALERSKTAGTVQKENVEYSLSLWEQSSTQKNFRPGRSMKEKMLLQLRGLDKTLLDDVAQLRLSSARIHGRHRFTSVRFRCLDSTQSFSGTHYV